MRVNRWMKPDVFDDGEASPPRHTTSGSGYAAVTTSTGGAFTAKVTGGRRYQALGADKNGGFSKVGHGGMDEVLWVGLDWWRWRFLR